MSSPHRYDKDKVCNLEKVEYSYKHHSHRHRRHDERRASKEHCSEYKRHKSSSAGVDNEKHREYHSNSDLTVRYEKSVAKRCYTHSEEHTNCQQRNIGEASNVNDEADYDFNWDFHKRALDKIFFSGDFSIKRNTKEYDDFWAFANKYIAFKRKKAAEASSLKPVTGGNDNQQPVYDQFNKLNFTWSLIAEKQLNRGLPYDSDESLTPNRLQQFSKILLLYLDFNQKQLLTKLQKIQKDQLNLPIAAYRDEIINTVMSNQVVVVAGDTGCGKSTQVPQYLLAAGFKEIACTQPRRIACMSLARRVSYETLNEFGSEVAYQVRFEKSRTQFTRILFLTEGLLLRQMASDPQLQQYKIIVIDEVHERHIHTDFLLGILKCLLRIRPDLKLVLMSATININLFASYFDNAPVVKVPGRLYPIQLQYVPLSAEEQSVKTERLNPAPYVRILTLIDHKYPSKERGDVLIFLSGMAEILSVSEALKAYASQTKRWIILLLHSTLSIAEQDKVFDYPPEGVRKCIVGTNIAETSVTIDGVRFVIDSGKVKEMSYDGKYKMQKLQEFWISRASAEQRKGRAGRTGPGVCYRLYEEADCDAMQEYSTPEIQRVPLDSLILQMISLGLPDARKFPFLEAPDTNAIERSIVTLKEQGALTADEKLSPIGQMLAQLPVDIVIGKMLIIGSIFELVEPLLTIAACLSIQSPYTARAHRDLDAMEARRALESEHGDLLTLMSAYNAWIDVKARHENSNKWCKRRGFEEQRFYEMSRLRQQFQELLEEYGLDDLGHEVELVTSQDRKEWYARQKQLRQLKGEQSRLKKRRKILKMEDEEWTVEHEGMAAGDNEDDFDSNIKDLEFRLKSNVRQLQERASDWQDMTPVQAALLKQIICSALYPQIALADDDNSYKSDTDQLFHTKTKNFVVLHPTSVFAQHPELLQLKETAEEETRRHRHNEKLRGIASIGHQMLAYVTLLETTKPFLIGAVRVPALHTLALFSHSVDTNADCTRLVFDGWLEVCLMASDTDDLISVGLSVVSNAVRLRLLWQQIIDSKLAESMTKSDDPSKVSQSGNLKRTFKKSLMEFIGCHVPYTIRRVLAAEAQHLYIGPFQGSEMNNVIVAQVLQKICNASGADTHPIKGGLQLTPFLTYNCLQDEETASLWGQYTSNMQKHWTCVVCGQEMLVTLAERLEHELVCQADTKADTANLADTVVQGNQDQKPSTGLTRHYVCSTCGVTLQVSTADILRHRKTCQPVETDISVKSDDNCQV